MLNEVLFIDIDMNHVNYSMDENLFRANIDQKWFSTQL